MPTAYLKTRCQEYYVKICEEYCFVLNLQNQLGVLFQKILNYIETMTTPKK